MASDQAQNIAAILLMSMSKLSTISISKSIKIGEDIRCVRTRSYEAEALGMGKTIQTKRRDQRGEGKP